MITVKLEKHVVEVNIDYIAFVNDIPGNNGSLCQVILTGDDGFFNSMEDQATIKSKIYEARMSRRGQ
jgi:hypothetical protein